MKLHLNGDAYQADNDTSVAQLLSTLNLNPNVVVVELNRKILAAEQFCDIALKDGDQVEIIQFVGGG